MQTQTSNSLCNLFVAEVLRYLVSRGEIDNILRKVSATLKASYKENLDVLSGQLLLNIDETEHKEDVHYF
ncbi:MAG: hypothetical protein AMR96_05850 [Candidatus Adiutrix intracellularis]|nr:MAG: hypothetical protein AMR96_05850 [Candidatus Adiutrix intracellularis]